MPDIHGDPRSKIPNCQQLAAQSIRYALSSGSWLVSFELMSYTDSKLPALRRPGPPPELPRGCGLPGMPSRTGGLPVPESPGRPGRRRDRPLWRPRRLRQALLPTGQLRQQARCRGSTLSLPLPRKLRALLQSSRLLPPPFCLRVRGFFLSGSDSNFIVCEAGLPQFLNEAICLAAFRKSGNHSGSLFIIRHGPMIWRKGATMSVFAKVMP